MQSRAELQQGQERNNATLVDDGTSQALVRRAPGGGMSCSLPGTRWHEQTRVPVSLHLSHSALRQPPCPSPDGSGH